MTGFPLTAQYPHNVRNANLRLDGAGRPNHHSLSKITPRLPLSLLPPQPTFIPRFISFGSRDAKLHSFIPTLPGVRSGFHKKDGSSGTRYRCPAWLPIEHQCGNQLITSPSRCLLSHYTWVQDQTGMDMSLDGHLSSCVEKHAAQFVAFSASSSTPVLLMAHGRSRSRPFLKKLPTLAPPPDVDSVTTGFKFPTPANVNSPRVTQTENRD